MTPFRLSAPTENGALLAQPQLSDWVDHARANQALFAQNNPCIGGINFSELRRQARLDVVTAAQEFMPGTEISPDAPLILTGHQPELFHPGVWVKSFAAYHLARKLEGASVQVIIDNDIVKATAIRVPAGGPDRYLLGHVPFDRWEGETPYEERGVVDETTFHEFPDRVRTTLSRLRFEPIVDELWKHVRAAGTRTKNLGERLTWGRHALEKSFGITNAEVPLSALCDRPAFRRLTDALLSDLPRFQSIYNQALANYRVKEKIRSKNHPATDLAVEGDWLEAPYWIWRSDDPVRRPLWIRTAAEKLEVRAGSEHLVTLSRTSADVLGMLREQPGGWKVRPRALISTMFLRAFIGDYFIHGLGGGKYDDATDDIIRQYFGLEPPGYAILTASLHLPGARPLHETSEQVRRRARDIYWNPDRYLDDALREREPLAAWIEEKLQAQQVIPISTEERRARFALLRTLNEKIRPYVEADRRSALEESIQLADLEESEGVLTRRDYPYCLYPRDSLQSLMNKITF